MNLLSSLRHEFHPQQLIPSLIAGLVTGLIAVIISMAFAAYLFAGDLSAYIPAGIGFMLFACMVISAITALTSSFPGVVADVQDNVLPVLALVVVTITSTMPASATSYETFITVVATVALSSILTGVSFWLIGQLNLGDLIRYIPYPVIGGFLAGSGLLLVLGAFSTMVDAPVGLAQLPSLMQLDILLKWLPGLILAVILLIVLRRFNHFLLFPGMLLLSVVLFYVVLWLSGTSIENAIDQGWLLGALPEGGLWQPLTLADLQQVNWPLVGGQIGSIFVVIIVGVITILLNATGLELATNEDIDLNRELKVTGVANIVAGLGGGMFGCHTLSDSILAYKMNAKGRMVGIFLAMVCGVVLFAGGSLLSLFPNFVLGGLLLFLGLDLLVEWVYEAWFKLPKTDYLVVILILVAMNVWGILEGIAVGIILAVILFVVDYSRIDVVKHELSASNYHSHVDRPRLYQQLLCKKGHWLYILELQGFIFFGTANKLYTMIHQQLNDSKSTTPRYIVLDFRHVSGFDSSAVLSFEKIKQLAQSKKAVLIFSQLSPKMERQLHQQIFADNEDNICRCFADLDHSVEWCEDQMIETFESVGFGVKSKTLITQLAQALPKSSSADTLLSYFERKDITPGTYLIRQDDMSNGLYFIETGEMTIQLESDNGQPTRLRTLSAGTVVGELGSYLGNKASASVVADQAGTVYYLAADNLKKMEITDPDIAIAFHRFIIGILSERVINLNNTVQSLLD